MSKGRIVLITLGFIVFCLAFYCLFPKYEMEVSNSDFFWSDSLSGAGRERVQGVLRLNRITGRITKEYIQYIPEDFVPAVEPIKDTGPGTEPPAPPE